MAKNVIFVGCADGGMPTKAEALANAALAPGNILLLNSSNKFIKHATAGTAAGAGFVYVADLNMLDKVTDAYAANDTVQAFQPKAGEYYNALVVAGAVCVKDGALTSDGAGRLKVATVGTDAVVCYADETVTPAADALVRVKFI